MRKEVLTQLDKLIGTGHQLTESFQLREYNQGHGTFRLRQYNYVSSLPEAELRTFVTSALATIERISGKDSQYYRNIPQDRVLSPLKFENSNLSFIPTVTGVLISLRNAVDQGLLQSLESRLRANIHDDFLVQASELLNASYHVAALVLTGGVLENHLEKMIHAHGLTLPSKGSISTYNDLLRDNAYGQPKWRRIQSISDLRNDAAHGKGSKITPEDAKDAHTFVQRFIVDYPA